MPAVAYARPDTQLVNDLDAMWNFYRYNYIDEGRVVSHDEGGITTSEGQSYAMLRAVWSGDRQTLDTVWHWTQTHLGRSDGLFSWKWDGRIVDENAATDADTDIALALLLASRRFNHPPYERQAKRIMRAIWEHETIEIQGVRYVTGGNWAPKENYPTVHVAYLAPYAYQVFAQADPSRPWRELVSSSYAILEWIFVDQKLPLPPERIYIDRKSGHYLLRKPGQKTAPRFSYDAFPIYWRVAADEIWFDRDRTALRLAMLAFFRQEWKAHGRILDTYELSGAQKSQFEGLPLYATITSLARVDDPKFARQLTERKLGPLRQAALHGDATPYYLHNWLWFDLGLQLQQIRHFDEFLAFLYPFDFTNFSEHFPLATLVIFLTLAFLSKNSSWRFHDLLKSAMIIAGIYLCARYLVWRAGNSLNFVEPAGPYISIALLAAEFYCFTTVLLLLLQVGLAPRRVESRVRTEGFEPSVDVLIPIYSESLEILENTLLAAAAMNYRNKTLYVCDDSHRDEVEEAARRLGAVYIRGPRQHAKAGNINNALKQSSGELVLIFDTDHIPVRTFLDVTVPYFVDPKLGFVQTAHHFYNRDIFQNALRTAEAVPNEQDMFHHGIQAGRNAWGGAFFVGTGAVFRRTALEQVGGLLLMSITEDIHTSQHLHAKGWKSHFVDKNLAVGLNAENLSSYLLQRTRWMQGCLQVFFKDNPLLTRGLPLRHRLGYFASQYYFFFPAARVIFLAAPLCFLLFHWHPIFAEVSTLLAYLLPFIVCLPVLSQSLLPGWPRILWATAYEYTVAVPLFRAMFDLILPKKLGFKVTPKGLSTDRRAYDFRSVRMSLIAAVVMVLAIVKGLWEFYFFGIEKDAYFFNLAWACVNLTVLVTPLIIAYERPRHRHQERVRKALPVMITGDGFVFDGTTFDLDQDGLSVQLPETASLPKEVQVELGRGDTLTLAGKVEFHDRDEHGRSRLGVRFLEPDLAQRRWILLQVHCDPETWETRVERRSRSNLVMCFHYFRGLWAALGPVFDMRRLQPRRRTLRIARASVAGKRQWLIVVDRSHSGLGVCALGKQWSHCGDRIFVDDDGRTFEIVHRGRRLPGLWRLGLAAALPVVIENPSVGDKLT